MSKLNLGDSLILDSDYSGSEVKTGATWIDGKPIYRKTFVKNTISPTTANNRVMFSSEGSIPNLDTFINAYGFAKMNDGTYANRRYEIPCAFCDVNMANQVTSGVQINTNNTVMAYFFVNTGFSPPTSAGIVYTVEYTKTTD